MCALHDTLSISGLAGVNDRFVLCACGRDHMRKRSMRNDEGVDTAQPIDDRDLTRFCPSMSTGERFKFIRSTRLQDHESGLSRTYSAKKSNALRPNATATAASREWNSHSSSRPGR